MHILLTVTELPDGAKFGKYCQKSLFIKKFANHFWVISRQLIQAMQPTLLDFYEIWYACRTSIPDSKYTNFFKISQVEPKLWVFKDGHFLCSLKQKVHEKFGGLTL